MRGEIEYINKMKEKILEAINNNEFDMYLMGESKYLIQSREIPQIQPGTGNLYNFMMQAIVELQNSNHNEMNFSIILLNEIKKLIYKGPHCLLNAVEIIRSILKLSKEKLNLLAITSEDLKNLTELIKVEASRLNKQLKETMSKLNSTMTIYDCLEYYNEYMYDHVGTKLI